MDKLDRIFLFNGIARKTIRDGNSSHIVLSLQVVLMTAIGYALFVTFNGNDALEATVESGGRQSLQATIWTSIIVFMSLWAILVFWTSAKRSVLFERPVDIELEAHCLALPFLLIIPGLAVIRFIFPLISFSARSMIFYYAFALLGFVFINLLGVVHLLTTENSIPEPFKNNSSRWIANWSRMRLLHSKRGDGGSLLAMVLAVISGGMYFGYENPISLSVPSIPVVRGLAIVTGAMAFWAVSSWICGNYRCKHLGDIRGMKTAILAIGQSLAYFFIALSITCAILTFVTAEISDAYLKSVAKSAPVILVILITVYAILDIVCIINGLLVMSSRYRPLLATGEDTAGPIAQSNTQPLRPLTGLDDICRRIGLIELLPAKTSAANVAELLTLKSTRSDLAASKHHPDMPAILRIQGIAFLAFSLIAHGFVVCVFGKPALARFMSVNVYEIDFLIGLGAALVYVILMIAAILGVLRLFKAKPTVPAICSSVGLSLLPLTLVMFILSLMHSKLNPNVGSFLYSCALMWGLGCLVMDIGSSVVSRSRLLLTLPAVLLTVIAVHFACGHIIRNAHLAVLRSMDIPLRSVENTIVDEFPTNMEFEIENLISKMENVDRVDVSAGDFVDQVMYSKLVATRFYGDGQYPNGLSPFRIRAEITSNARWMRRLHPEMSRLTRLARTPDDVVQIVSKWLGSKMVETTRITWPLGTKFDQDPITTLTCKRGNQMDAAILMIAALRASGVAARPKNIFPDELVSNAYALAEYYDGTQWKPCYPKTGPVTKPPVRQDDLARFRKWISNVPQGSKLALNIIIDGVCYPYSAGRTAPIMFTYDPAPGTYLASYTQDDVCHTRRFLLRPSVE